jgi:beta-galactosidase
MRIFSFARWVIVLLIGLTVIDIMWIGYIPFNKAQLPAVKAQVSYTPPATNRVKFNFNSDWKFIKQDVTGAEQPSFNDSSWTTVSVPHTFNETDTFDDWSRYEGETEQWQGRTWYRKHFKIDSAYSNRKIFIEFQGVRQISDVYINGTLLGQSKTGFTPFGFDLTPYIKFGDQENILAVRVDNRFPNGIPWNDPQWHPPLGGIYTDVYLHITDKLYVTLPLYSFLQTSGTYVYASNITSSSADVTVKAEVKNDYTTSRTVEYLAEVVDNTGAVVLTLTDNRTLNAGSKLEFSKTGTIFNPKRWDPSYPHVYRVFTTLKVGGVPVDTYETPLGIRTFRFSASTGFTINDRRLKLKGWGQRQTNEWAGLGVAFPDWMHDLTLKLMKDAGANFLRWGHCAGSPVNIQIGDKYGLITIQPGVDGEADTSGTAWDIRASAFRDTLIYFRNNPSIFIWEGGNQSVSEDHVKQLKGYKTQWDPNGQRAYAHRRSNSTVCPYNDITIGTEGSHECPSLPVVEGEYNREESPRRSWDQFSDYNCSTGTYSLNSEEFAVNQVTQYKKISSSSHCGGANWVFTDTTSRGRVPCEVARASGELDAVRLPKEAYFALKSMWRPEPQVHIVGHWNLPSGSSKNIHVISNCDEVELFVNGSSKGKGTRTDTYLFTFNNVSFSPGTIKAVGVKGGQTVTQEKQTAGTPARIKLTPITGPGGMRADGSDVLLIDAEVLDANGRRCPTYQKRIDFSISGPGIWRGGYNSGKIDSINNKYLDIEAGIQRVAVRSTLTPGTITVSANISGLQSDSISVQSKAVTISNGLSLEMPPLPPYPLGGEPTPSPTPTTSPTPEETPTPSPTPAGILITNLSYSGPNGPVEVKTNTANGQVIFKDRTYTFTDLPSYLVGGEYVQLPNEDKLYVAADLINFTAGKNAAIYVAHDDRLPRPTWLTTDFTDTGDNISINGTPSSLFKQEVTASTTLTLGGNRDTTSSELCNMYVLFAVESGNSIPPVINESFSSSTVPFTVVRGGTWTVTNGQYQLTNAATATGNGNISVHNTSITGDFVLTADASAVPSSSTWDDFSIIFGFTDANNYYFASFNESDNSTTNGLFRVQNGTVTELSNFSAVTTASTTLHKIRIERSGSLIKVVRNNIQLVSATVTDAIAGRVGVGAYNNNASFDNLVVTGTTSTNPTPTATPISSPTPTVVTVINETFGASTTNFTNTGGTWTVSNGLYNLTNPNTNVTIGNGNLSIHKTSVSGDFTLIVDGTAPATSSNFDDFSVIFGYVDANNYYFASFNESNDANTNGIFRISNGTSSEIADFSAITAAGSTLHRIKIERSGTTLTVSKGATVLGTVTISGTLDGKVGLGTRNNAATFDNLKVTNP